MSVQELLATHSSKQLREWMAYEVKAGPLSPRWRDDILAEIHYLLQWNTHLLGAKVPTKDKKNPAPPPKFPARPWAPDPFEGEEPDELDELEQDYEAEYGDVT